MKRDLDAKTLAVNDEWLEGEFIFWACSTCGGNCGQCSRSGIPFHLVCESRHSPDQPCPEPPVTWLLPPEKEAFR